MATFTFTGGNKWIAPKVVFADNIVLNKGENEGMIRFEATAAGKAVTLGLINGEALVIVNNGATNSFTAKNLAGDTGTVIAAGKVALVIGSTTANATEVYILN